MRQRGREGGREKDRHNAGTRRKHEISFNLGAGEDFLTTAQNPESVKGW